MPEPADLVDELGRIDDAINELQAHARRLRFRLTEIVPQQGELVGAEYRAEIYATELPPPASWAVDRRVRTIRLSRETD